MRKNDSCLNKEHSNTFPHYQLSKPLWYDFAFNYFLTYNNENTGYKGSTYQTKGSA